MLKKIYVLVGIAASGKSTYVDKLLKDHSLNITYRDFLVLNADTIREELYGDPTIQGDGRVVFGKLFDQYSQTLKDDTTELIIIDNTSLTPKIRKRYHILAKTITPMFQHTFEYNMVFFKPNLERSLEWNRKRDRFVPEDVIISQAERYMGPSEKEKKYANIIEVE